MILNKGLIIKKVNEIVGRVRFSQYFSEGKIGVGTAHKNEFLFERKRNGYIARVYYELTPENLKHSFKSKKLYAIEHLGNPDRIEIINLKLGLVEYEWFE